MAELYLQSKAPSRCRRRCPRWWHPPCRSPACWIHLPSGFRWLRAFPVRPHPVRPSRSERVLEPLQTKFRRCHSTVLGVAPSTTQIDRLLNRLSLCRLSKFVRLCLAWCCVGFQALQFLNHLNISLKCNQTAFNSPVSLNIAIQSFAKHTD